MESEAKVSSGYFTAASSPADYTVNLGFVPDEVQCWNETTTEDQVSGFYWQKSMGADKGIQFLVGIDTGKSTGWVTSNGITSVDSSELAVGVWTASTAYVVGDVVHPPTNNGYYYVCTTAGTSHTAQPTTWGTTVGGTTSEGGGTCVWTCHNQEDYPMTKSKVQGFTLAAEQQIASTKCHFVARKHQTTGITS